ncbi:MAG: 2-oxo-4-hydroxy-4-carboxy-5-ureidoimidazoline decarboxylase [Polyangiales bacterium]
MPFSDEESLMGRADAIWWSLDRKDWDEAFSAHPRIGSKKDVEKKPEKSWSSREQAGAAAANDDTLAALAQANADYEARFGRIYIVCATGKTADEMLAIAKERMSNDPDTELRRAVEEQRRITDLRLEKLVLR